MPVTRLLDDRAALAQNLRLALNLVAHRSLDRSQGVHVLGFGARAQLLLAAGTQRHVGVTAQVAALHAGIRNAECHHDVADGCHISLGKFGSVGFGAVNDLGHNFNERNTGAVVVDQRVLGALDAAGGSTNVSQLAGVFFHVGTLDVDRHNAAVGQLDVDLALERDGLVVLRDLIVLRKVGVEVVLARKPRRGGNRATQREAQADGVAHGLFVDHGQGPGQAEAHRSDVGVGFATKLVGCRREHFGLGVELDVHLEAEHGLKELERLVEVHQFCLSHQAPPRVD